MSMASLKPTAQTIALAQLCSTSDKVANLLQISRCAGLARQQNCSMLFLPECFGFLGGQTWQHAEPGDWDDCSNSANDPFLEATIEKLSQDPNSEVPEPTALGLPSVSLSSALRYIARVNQLWISAGGMHVRCDDGPEGNGTNNNHNTNRVYNTHWICDHHGQTQAVYRKVHLFDVCIPGQVDLRESRTTAPGTALVLCDSPIGKLGLSTCYDVRFPEMYLELVRRGAQVLLVPSAFTVPTGRAHWHILLRARAIENQCFVLAAAQCGQHNEKRASYGHSLAVDPWGTILADAGDDDDSPKIVTCTIDPAMVDSTRERMPLADHRQAAQFLD